MSMKTYLKEVLVQGNPAAIKMHWWEPLHAFEDLEPEWAKSLHIRNTAKSAPSRRKKNFYRKFDLVAKPRQKRRGNFTSPLAADK
ncbi:MAG: hypothetical protein DYG98_06020 [Haliscomenobacteraceae bacterium CHB4]|nr:hypothetical protein [Haliscomenobacteraceae bacterium CHB4]